jgi:hypothetical protein
MPKHVASGGMIIVERHTKEEADFYGRQGVAKMLKATSTVPVTPPRRPSGASAGGPGR